MEQKTLFAKNLEDLNRVASAMLEAMPEERIFALHGKMGAGKTTLIKALCQILGVQEIVSSPTFALVNEYSTLDEDQVFHFDFYRIKKLKRYTILVTKNTFTAIHIVFVEWPEMISDLLPQRYVKVEIEVMPNEERKSPTQLFSLKKIITSRILRSGINSMRDENLDVLRKN